MSTNYSQFLKELPTDDCRYIAYYYEYSAGADGERSKIVFIMWAPETSRIKSKMVYAGSKEVIKKALEGIQIGIEATDISEVDEETIKSKCFQVSR